MGDIWDSGSTCVRCDRKTDFELCIRCQREGWKVLNDLRAELGADAYAKLEDKGKIEIQTGGLRGYNPSWKFARVRA